jgi:hypothetical protein
MSSVDNVQLWLKLVQLKARHPGLLGQVITAAREPDAINALRVLETAMASPVLLRQPLFSELDPALLLSVHQFIDLHPTGDGTVVSADGCFTYIAAEVADRGETTTLEWLHQVFFSRLLELYNDHASFGSELRRAAGEEGFDQRVAELDSWLLPQSKTDRPVWPALLTAADPKRETEESDWRRLLGRQPRLSQIPAEYVAVDPTLLPRPLHVHRGRFRDPTRYAEASRLMLEVAAAADPAFGTTVKARLDVARDVLARRKFAKIHMLEFGWPELMGRVRAPDGQRRLALLEKAVLFGSDEAELAESWEMYRTDERLVDFLRIRPHLGEIYGEELSNLVAATGGPSAGSGDSAPGSSTITQLPPYRDVRLNFAAVPGTGDAATAPRSLRGQFRISGLDEPVEVELPVAELLTGAAELGNVYNYFPDVRSDGTAMRDLVAADPRTPGEDAARLLGEKLWEAIFERHPELSTLLTAAIGGIEPVRLIISADTSWVTNLPWECLYLPALHRMAGHTIKISVIRHVPDAAHMKHPPLVTPIRMLVVHAEPTGMPLPGTRQEIEVLERIFARAEQHDEVRLHVLRNATAESLKRTLRRIRPHIFHFVGHAGGMKPAGLVLCDDTQDMEVLASKDLADLLETSEVLLAVLNGCETGVERVGLTHGICQTLIRSGLPAAIATTRPIPDTSALWFSRELYRALIDGYPLEASVAEARKALRMKRWDWSAYSFYSAEPSRLGDLIFPNGLG